MYLDKLHCFDLQKGTSLMLTHKAKRHRPAHEICIDVIIRNFWTSLDVYKASWKLLGQKLNNLVNLTQFLFLTQIVFGFLTKHFEG